MCIQFTDSDVSGGPVDEDIVALDVTMNNVVFMQKGQPSEYLHTPALHCLPAHHRVLAQITVVSCMIRILEKRLNLVKTYMGDVCVLNRLYN